MEALKKLLLSVRIYNVLSRIINFEGLTIAMESPISLYRRRALKDFLNQLSVIPIDQVEEEDRICGICFEHYGLELPLDPDGTSLEQLSVSASASCYSLMDFNPFSEEEPLSPDDIIVKTEIWIETQVVAETYTVYRKHHGDFDLEIVDVEPEAHARQYDQPVRLPCGHIFGRSCLRKWSVSIELLLFKY